MPFNPLSITGCTLWLKGDSGVYHDAGTTLATNGQSAAQWNDQSGNAHHATIIATPTYVTGLSPSGLGAINFSSNGASNLGFTVGSPYTIFVVYSVHTAAGNHRAVQGSNNWLIGPRSGFHTHFNGGFVSGTGLAFTADLFVIGSATNSGSASTIEFNGVDKTTAGGTTGTPGTLCLGATGNASSEGLGTSGDVAYIAEVLVYTSVLGSTDRGNVTTYLTRWQNAAPAPSATGACLLPAM